MSKRPRWKFTGDKPTFAIKKPLELNEIPNNPIVELALVNEAICNAYMRTYRLGECSVVVTKEDDNWHLSIAHHNRYPTWDEIAEARYRILPDNVMMVMVLPPIHNYINLHPNCFQLVEIGSRFTNQR